MTTLSTEDRLLLDTHPQQSTLYLSIYEPSIALIGQTTGEYSVDTREVSYSTITGSYTSITENLFQVALIGTSPGLDDKGRTWVRSATSSVMKFVESDHINWEVGDYITVLNYTEIIPVFPRIIKDPNDEENVIFYKNYDVEYTNQNSILGTFIVMGSNCAGFLDPVTNECDVYYSASGTTNLLGDDLTYQWIFEGATVTGSTAHTPGNITYTTPGHYRTFLTVTSSSGRVETSVRYISIYDRPGHGSFTPILNWEFTEPPSGTRESGGYKFSIKIREKADFDKLRDGSLVIIFADEWYGDTKKSIGGNSIGRSHVKFVGYIRNGTIRHDYLDSSVEFEVVSPTIYMQDEECFSVSVESKKSPTTWYELLDMNCRRAIYHYLAWHSTVLICCDFTWVNEEDDRYIQYFDADRTSLYDAVQTLMGGTLHGRFLSDRQGNLYCEKDHNTIGSSRYEPVYEITKKDWIEQPSIEERLSSEVSFIEMGGIAYDPNTGESAAYLASAPGVAPRYKGNVERIQGLALESQDDLNTQVGHLLANMNAKYSIDMKLRGNFANLDIAPLNCVGITLAENDTPRKLIWDNKKFAVSGITWQFDPNYQYLIPNLSLLEIVDGFPGTTIIIPEIPPDEGGDGGSYEQPPFDVPPIPPPSSLPSGVIVSPVLLMANVRVSIYQGMDNEAALVDFYDGTLPRNTHITIDTHNIINMSNPLYLDFTQFDTGVFLVMYYIQSQFLYPQYSFPGISYHFDAILSNLSEKQIAHGQISDPNQVTDVWGKTYEYSLAGSFMIQCPLMKKVSLNLTPWPSTYSGSHSINIIVIKILDLNYPQWNPVTFP